MSHGGRPRFSLFLESVRHSRPRQLAARAGLMLRRAALERVPWFGDRRRAMDPGETPPLAPSVPPPVFPPRLALAHASGGRPFARFLGREYPLTPPIAWHRRGLAGETHLQRLTFHYMEYLEAVDDAAFAPIVLDWIDRNPPYRRGDWRDSWNSYALSIRTVVWMQQWEARRIEAASPPAVRILGSLARQLAFLERNVESDIGGNHILKNAKALVWAGRFFAGPEAARWRALGESILDRELGEQFLADGVHFERSPAYHAQVTADLLECWTVLADGAVRDRLSRTMAAAAQALCDLTHPDGGPSLFNDGGLHMSYLPGTILEALQRTAGSTTSPRSVFALKAAGYFGAGEGGDFVLADCGAIGPDHLPAHAHGDVLSFEWSVDGRRVVVDTGVFEYEPGPRRARSRSTAAHNTLTLDDRDQAEFWSSFRVGRRPRVTIDRYDARPDGFVLEGSHDGYARLAGSPRHVRRFAVGPRAIDVEDRVEGGSGQRARARLLFAPGLSVIPTAGGALIEGEGLRIALATTASVTVVDAPWWPDFGVERPARQIVLDYGQAPCRGGFVLSVEVPREGRKPPHLRAAHTGTNLKLL